MTNQSEVAEKLKAKPARFEVVVKRGRGNANMWRLKPLDGRPTG